MGFSNDIILGHDHHGKPIILAKKYRSRHALLLGATGVGKSKVLESLLRQDLLAWPRTRAGIALFDPHGTVVDNLIAFAAAAGLNSLPIIPFDCRRSSMDYVLSFNPLRARPGIEPATIVSSCIDSLLHAWGTFGDQANSVPRLEKWLRVMLLTIFLSGGTLSDSLALLRSPPLRRAMARAVEDDVAQAIWESSINLKESEFQTITESLANRVMRFVSATMLKLSLNQTGPSLDFGTVLEKGQIVLISLATTGGAIDDLDARTLGSLLLQDLWTAAKVRGKGESGQKRSFRVYMDEFSRFLTPTMAEGLAEARGFGLELLFACQSLTQLQATPAGQQVLNAVLANAYTKIVFNVQHAEDLDILAPWLFRNVADVNQVKFQPFSTKVLGHELQYHQSTSRSTTRGTSVSSNWSTTESSGVSKGTSRGRSTSRGTSRGAQRSRSLGTSTSKALGTGSSHAKSVAESDAKGSTESRAAGRTKGKSDSQGESRHLDGEYDDLAKIVGPEPTTTFDRAYVDEDEDHRALKRTIDKSTSKGESESDSQSSSLATTQSKSRAQSSQDSTSESQSESSGETEALSEGENVAESMQVGDTSSVSESVTRSSAETAGGGQTESESTTEGVTLSPMLMPILGQEAGAPMYRTIEEQLFAFSQRLAALPDRHAIVRTGTTPPVEITTPTIDPPGISAKGARAWATMRLKKLAFVLPYVEAVRRLEERRRAFEERFLGSLSTGEPIYTTRRIKE